MQVHMKNLNKNFNQKKDTNLIWTEIQKEMKSKFGSEIYESWLKKIYFEEQHSNYLVVSVSTRFLRDWIVSRYLDEILKIVKKQIREISRIEFRIEDKEHEKDKAVNNIIKKDDNISFLKDSFLQYNRIDQNKSFDNFKILKFFLTFKISKASLSKDGATTHSKKISLRLIAVSLSTFELKATIPPNELVVSHFKAFKNA